MDRFVFIFGLIVFISSIVALIINFLNYDGTIFIASILAMLNGAVAMGVGEILGRVKGQKEE